MKQIKRRFTVALDLAKFDHTGRILDTQTGEISSTIKIEVSEAGFNTFEQILKQYSPNPKDFVIGCEATGHYGETILRRLQAQGYDFVRLNPTQVSQFRRGLGRKAKTDALDAEAMARQLAISEVSFEAPLQATQRALQRITRLRLDFIEAQSRWVNRVRSLLNQVFPELETRLKKLTTVTSLQLLSHYPTPAAIMALSLAELATFLQRASRGQHGLALAEWLKTAAATSVGLRDPWLATELKLAIRQLVSVNQSIIELEQGIAELTDQLLAEHSQALGLREPLTIKSFPYGGSLSIGTILAEIGPITRFRSIKQLLSYLGWCPNTSESGTFSSPHPKMSHQGNRFARRMIWLLAVGSVRSVPEYQAYYQQRLAAGKNKMKTIVAIGRKWLSVFFALLRTGQPYDPNRYLKFQPKPEPVLQT